MKRLIQTLALTLTLVLASALVHASGVLVDASGNVSVKLPGKSATPAKSGTELPDGSVVDVRDGGHASVMLMSGAVDEIASGSSYKVGEEKKVENRTELGGGIGKAMRELAASGQGPTVHGMVRDVKGPGGAGGLSLGFGGGFENYYPRRTTIILGKKTSFGWDKSVRINWPTPVIVVDSSSGKHLSVIPVKSSSKNYSAATARMGIVSGKKYEWYLGSGMKNPKRKSAKSPFATLSASKIKRYAADKKRIESLKMSDEGKKMLLAQLDFQYKLYGDMVGILLPVWKTNKSAFVKKLIYLGYHRMGDDRAKNFR
jgi:hypothetical protein